MRPVFLPRNLHEVWEAWDRAPEAAVYSGGTDLLVKMRAGIIDPSALICLEQVNELTGVRDEGDSVFVGAANTHAELLTHPVIQAYFPVLVQALQVLAGPAIRHMGTIGGNVVNASPGGDTLPALYILHAEVEVWNCREARKMPLSRFILGPGRVLLKRGELMGGLRIPKLSAGWLHHYEKVGLRKAQTCAVASLAGLLKTDGKGRIEEARLAWGSVGPTVVVSQEAEGILKGRPLSRESLLAAIPAVQRAVSPIDDVRASANYRRMVAGNLLLRLSLLAGS